MRGGLRIVTLIPALNEEGAIARVIEAVPAWVDEIVVIDNGSTDDTAEIAAAAGARVISEPQRGYGAACLAGLAAIGQADIAVFVDGDYSDYPEKMGDLVDPIVAGDAEFALGSRVPERGALTVQQRVGNRVACALMRWVWRAQYTDLGPFRAIRWERLQAMKMEDRGYGWTIEMQIKATWLNLRTREIAVPYRPRIGRSKISGTVSGTIGAATKICWVIATHAVGRRRAAVVAGARATS